MTNVVGPQDDEVGHGACEGCIGPPGRGPATTGTTCGIAPCCQPCCPCCPCCGPWLGGGGGTDAADGGWPLGFRGVAGGGVSDACGTICVATSSTAVSSATTGASADAAAGVASCSIIG